MSRAADRLRPVWQVLRRGRPGVTQGVERAVLASRGRIALVGEVQGLRARLAELERDHLLLAAHVAVLTERLGSPAGPEGDEAARTRARLAAIAFYEQRIAALEERLEPRRRARPPGGRMSVRRTSGERPETVS